MTDEKKPGCYSREYAVASATCKRCGYQKDCRADTRKCWNKCAETKADEVNHPAHYTQGGVECIDAIEAALTPEEFRGYCKGNAIKYTWREKHKGGNQSIEKAMWYMKRMLGKEQV